MGLLWFLLLILAILIASISVWRKNQQANEFFVLGILKILSGKFSRANVTIEACVPGAHVRKMHVEGDKVTMTYEYPVGENTLGLPRVLSGTMSDSIEWKGCKFSSLQFTFAHGKEKDFPLREVLGYEIMLYKDGALSLEVSGIIGKKTLGTSMHLANFEEVIARAGGA